MGKTLYRILAGLIILLLLPLGLFTVYEYTKINDNEAFVNSVYKSQLETIVSSINTYNQDVVSNWASRIELMLNYPGNLKSFEKLTAENKAITAIYTVNNNKINTIYAQNNNINDTKNIVNINTLQAQNINQLKNYFENGYRKFLTQFIDDNNFVLYFFCSTNNNKPIICFLTINLGSFLANYVNPRIQSIAQNNFIISLINSQNGNTLLSTEKNYKSNNIYDQQGQMWLLPQINIGISLKSLSISDMAQKRVTDNIVVIIIALIIIIAGAWFLFAGVKREVQLAQIKSEFIANVSHEIRTPLALISMYIETLEMGRIKTTEKITEYYNIIANETQRLNNIVNSILNFSRLENGKQKLKPEICDINFITQKVLDTYMFHIKNKNFELLFLQGQNLPPILCDPQTISDSIVNLIDNAIKYSADNKKIEIYTGIFKKYVFVEVKDYGIGISKKNQKLVFDKFYRVTNQNIANQVKGTGLGLSIVSQVVKMHKGKIILNSKPAQGSSFKICLPFIKTKNKQL